MQFLLGTVTVAFSTTMGEGGIGVIITVIIQVHLICLPDHLYKHFFQFQPLNF